MVPQELYSQIVASVPIACVDIILSYQDKYVLIKRAQQPLKGEWWTIGGAVRKGEKLENAAYRKVIEETGLTPKNLTFRGVYQDTYELSEHNCSAHAVSVVFTAVVDEYTPVVDSTSSDIGLFDEAPERLIKNLL